MTVVYFDRNVFADICEFRRGLTTDDVARIQHAVDSGSIMIPAGSIVMEETISLLHDSEEKYRHHIGTVLNLINKDRMIKKHSQLTDEDCRSYAFNEPKTDRMREIPSNFRGVLEFTANRDDLNTLAKNIRSFYQGMAVAIQAGLEKAIEEGNQMNIGKADSFHEVWNKMSPVIVQNLVASLPRTPKRLCRKRGLDPMLNIKSIRMYAVYYCWLLYSYWLKSDGTPGKMKPSDGGDFFHAVCVSAADVFVTQESKDKEGKLPWILSQVPIRGLKIMSLRELLETI